MVAQALPSPGGHQDEAVHVEQGGVHRGQLVRPELVDAELGAQRLEDGLGEVVVAAEQRRVQAVVLMGPNSIETFLLEFWLEKSLEIWLEIPYTKKKLTNW